MIAVDDDPEILEWLANAISTARPKMRENFSRPGLDSHLRRKNKMVIWNRWFAALLFMIWENFYFGWHAFPKSDAEILADGICVLLLSLSWHPKTGALSAQEGE